MDALLENQVNPETEGSALFLLAEGLVLLLSLLRIFVVAIVLAVNIIALRRGSRVVKCHCLTLYVSDSVKICSVIYITTWIPFLIYSLLNGRWLLIDEQIFCLIQNYMTNAILLVLLAMAALLGYTKLARGSSNPKCAAGLTLAAWILPQFAFFIILTTVEKADSQNQLNFDFLEDLLSDNKTTPTMGITYKIGFTICGQNLCRLALTQYILQYVVIILPICIVSTLCYIRHLCGASLSDKSQPGYSELDANKATDDVDDDDCHDVRESESPALEIILVTNVLWLTLIRPVVLFMWSPDHLFVDLGSHLMLTVAAVFAPILPQQIVTRKVTVFRIERHTSDNTGQISATASDVTM